MSESHQGFAGWVRAGLPLEERRRELARFLLIKAKRDFIYTWAFRSASCLLPILLKVLKTRSAQPGSLLWEVVWAILGWQSVGFGAFASGYFGVFRLAEAILKERRSQMKAVDAAPWRQRWDTAVSALLASLVWLAVPPDPTIKRILGQYGAVRAGQCLYEWARVTDPQGVAGRLGDWLYVLLFTASSGQVVYSFATRPWTLDPEYQAFLTRVTVIHPTIIQTIRNVAAGRFIDHQAIQTVLEPFRRQEGGRHWHEMALGQVPTLVDCDWIHPESGCGQKIAGIWPYIFRMMLPIYTSLHALPPLVFRWKQVIGAPLHFLQSVLKNALQSSSFMATFILIFQVALCGHRKVTRLGMLPAAESAYFYGLLGSLSAASIGVEKAHRRVELALYVLPKAIIAFIRAVEARHNVSLTVPHIEFILFALSMPVILDGYRRAPDRLPNLLNRILRVFLSPHKP